MALKDNKFIFLVVNSAFRVIQLSFACAVIGLYAQDLDRAHRQGKYTDSKWAYATAVGTLSAFTALVYLMPFLPHRLLTPWDLLLFILWVVVFGIFGGMYIHEDPEGVSGIERMKAAVWVDLVNMLLWLLSAVAGGVAWWSAGREKRSLHTGRAKV